MCKDEPKLYYIFVIGKIKHNESIIRLQENKEVYENPKQMSEVLHKNFQKVFTTGCNFKKPQVQRRKMRPGK